jgi:hypothetical protein
MLLLEKQALIKQMHYEHFITGDLGDKTFLGMNLGSTEENCCYCNKSLDRTRFNWKSKRGYDFTRVC